MNAATVHRVLDPDAARPLLARVAPAAASGPVEVESVWAKPGRHFNVCWRVGDDGARASLCVVRDDEAARAMRRAVRSGVSCVAMADRDVLAQAFPFDYRLPRLGDCVRPEAARRALGDGGADACEVVAYRAGMRCQVRFDLGGRPRAYAKASVEKEPGRRREAHQWVERACAGAALRVPHVIGSDDTLGLDFVEAVGGRSLHDLLQEGRGADALAAAVRGLAEARALVPAPPWREHRAADELWLLGSWCSWMDDIDQALASRLRTVLASLEATAPAPSAPGFSHRDFHDRQVLVDGDSMWLLDVDTACNGDAELDLGNLLAHLHLRGLQWERAHAGLEETALAAWGDGARPDAVRWYRRASLARLACVYRLRPRWSLLAGELLAEAWRS